jgi:hypothetical protein
VEIGSTDGARLHPQEHLAGLRPRLRNLRGPKRRPRRVEEDRPHEAESRAR